LHAELGRVDSVARYCVRVATEFQHLERFGGCYCCEGHVDRISKEPEGDFELYGFVERTECSTAIRIDAQLQVVGSGLSK